VGSLRRSRSARERGRPRRPDSAVVRCGAARNAWPGLDLLDGKKRAASMGVTSAAVGHPYRARSTAVPRASWRDWRTLAVVFAAFCALLLGCFSSHTTLACDRRAGTCQLTKATVTETSARSVAVADLAGASLKVTHGARWLTTYQLALETRGGPLSLTPAGSQDQMQAFVDAVDGFVHAPQESRVSTPGTRDFSLSTGYGSVWGRFEAWSVVLGLLFLIFAYSLPTVRMTADRFTQRLVFDIRPFGPLLARRRFYALSSVREARVSERGTPAWVELLMTDETSVRLPGSVAPRGSCQVLATRINDVLRA
jgi:hypothetical protein